MSLHGKYFCGGRGIWCFAQVKVAEGVGWEQVSDCLSRGIGGRQEQVPWGLKVVSYCPRPHAHLIVIARLWGALGPSTLKKNKSEKLSPKQGTNRTELWPGLLPQLCV